MRISDWSSDVCSSDLLDRHVQGGRRLVGDDDLGIVQNRDGDGDALAHAAGQLVRIGAQPGRRIRDADPPQGLFGASEGLLSRDLLVRLDRKSVVSGKSVSVRVDLGGRRIIKKKKKTQT